MISCCSEPFFSFVPFPSPVVSEASGPYFFFPPGSLRIFGLRLQQAAKLGDPMASNLLADRYAREEDAAHDAVRFYRQAKLFGVANRPPCWVEKILWSPVRTTIFLGWYASTKRKRHGESLWPFFWLKPTEADWLASIFCLQVEDTLHFCGFPSNIAIIQSSQSSNHFLSVSLPQIRKTSKGFGLGRNQNPLQAALAGQLPTRYNIGTSGHFYFAQGRPQRGINGVITPIIRVITPVTHL